MPTLEIVWAYFLIQIIIMKTPGKDENLEDLFKPGRRSQTRDENGNLYRYGLSRADFPDEKSYKRAWRKIRKEVTGKTTFELECVTPKDWYMRVKRTAKYRNLEFSITLEEFESFREKPCHYCGSKTGKPSLDRINNLLGYTISNVVQCCWECNTAKSDSSYQDFMAYLLRVHFHIKERLEKGEI